MAPWTRQLLPYVIRMNGHLAPRALGRCSNRKEVVLMSDATSTGTTWDRRRWLILGVIALAQLMVVLDSTIAGFPQTAPS
jgi:hypothetical protein